MGELEKGRKIVKAKPAMFVGMAWYRRQDYPRVLEIMTDRYELDDSHGEWLGRAKATERRLIAEGHSVSRITLDPDVFLAWCRLRGLDTIGASRSEFAAEKCRESHLKGREGRTA